jgi:hypothetical protein
MELAKILTNTLLLGQRVGHLITSASACYQNQQRVTTALLALFRNGLLPLPSTNSVEAKETEKGW